MKESLRETHKSISPKYHSEEKEANVTTSSKECHQTPRKLTTTKGKSAEPWTPGWSWMSCL
jgi:hypothetical protein